MLVLVFGNQEKLVKLSSLPSNVNMFRKAYDLFMFFLCQFLVIWTMNQYSYYKYSVNFTAVS